MPIFVNVAGVQQKSTRPTVNVAGVNQRLKEGWVNVAGVQQKFFSAEDDLTMVTGISGAVAGYAHGGFGNMTPTTLGDGTTVDQLLLSSHTAPTPDLMQLFFLNYPGAITAAYLSAVTINGTAMPMSGPLFSFTGGAPGGSAEFIWSSQRAVFPTGVGGVTVPVIIVRT